MAVERKALFTAANDDGRELWVNDEDGTVFVMVYGPNKMTTRYEVELADGEIEELQLALAAHLHRKRGGC